QIAPQWRDQIPPGSGKSRVSSFQSDRFFRQGSFGRFTPAGPVMDEGNGPVFRIFWSLPVEQAAQGKIDSIPDCRILSGAKAVEQSVMLIGVAGNSRKIVLFPRRDQAVYQCRAHAERRSFERVLHQIYWLAVTSSG